MENVVVAVALRTCCLLVVSARLLRIQQSYQHTHAKHTRAHTHALANTTRPVVVAFRLFDFVVIMRIAARASALASASASAGAPTSR